MSLENKIALITGGASGIGKAVATAFAKEGASVWVVDVQKHLGEQTMQEIREGGGDANFLAGDVSNAKDVDRVVDEAVRRHGRIDVLVNNAAACVKGTIATLSENEWDRQLNVNLKGAYLFSHRVIPVMKSHGGGVIINTGSVTSVVGVRDFAAYVASKAGILGITRAMALDHAKDGIRVNCICPGPIETPLIAWQFANAADPDLERKRVIDLQPNGRMASPEELAHLFVYLASNSASFVTGSIFTFDGGYTAQ